MAKNTGKVFEEEIKKSVDKLSYVYYYRLRDPASSFNQSADSGLRLSVTNDYDCFVFRRPCFFPLELKSSKTTSFSFQRDKKDKGKNIKLSQVNGLLKASKVEGVFAGLLFNFSDKVKTYWMNIIEFDRFFSESAKGSINESDIINYGGILVEQTIKKVAYNYNIQRMLDDIK
jgi:recombination protein U